MAWKFRQSLHFLCFIVLMPSFFLLLFVIVCSCEPLCFLLCVGYHAVPDPCELTYYLLFLGMMVIKSLVIRKSLQGRRVL